MSTTKMPATKLITGMGAALVDLFADVSDDTLAALGSPKTSMSLIEATQSAAMQKKVTVHTQRPGGSAANTIAGIAALGLDTGFVGKIGNDSLGDIFAAEMAALNVAFSVIPCDPAVHPTGHCLVLVTPDAERTMHTVLGASVTTTHEDLDAALIARTGLFYAEGYIWDSPSAQQAFLQAASQVRAQGGKIVFSLADAFCVQRHRGAFLALLDSHIDILLANAYEAEALFDTQDDTALAERAAAHKLLMAVTRGAAGALVSDHDGNTHMLAGEVIDDVVDLTGAGDQFAAGFLAALHGGHDPVRAGRTGIVAASEVIRHVGPRPQSDVAALLARKDLSI